MYDLFVKAINDANTSIYLFIGLIILILMAKLVYE